MSNGVALLLDQVLTEQAEMSAVELFSELHDVGLAGETRWYRNLMPASSPGPGQQYGFEVDLDSCTGCKACVTACHSRNGLDEGESWRSAGLLEANRPQVVTTACHHCVEPACLAGCPVNAYEKDAITGIVVHLDDQCIGCGYCLMTCPYEVPRFNDRLGIVRKCDMCRGRLSVGEAPACVEACPNAAIRVAIVDVAAQREAAAAGRFLVGAPAPSKSVPSTVYRSKRGLAEPLAVASELSGATPPGPGRSELPLVVTLVLSQLASGVAVAGAAVGSLGRGIGAGNGGSGPVGAGRISAGGVSSGPVGAVAHSGALVPGLAVLTLVLGLAAVAASVTHLGRPRYAWRAVLGVGHSWLSREVLAIGTFVGSAAAWASVSLAAAVVASPGSASSLLASLSAALGWVTAATGMVVIVCSVMVYAVTGRRWWRASLGLVRFACTAAFGALAGSALVVALLGGRPHTGWTSSAVAVALVSWAVFAVICERLARVRLTHKSASGEMAGSAALLGRRVLRSLSGWRLGCIIAGALLLGDGVALAAPGAGRVLAAMGLVLVVAGELVGRSIFFLAAAPARMPGGRV